LNNIYEILAKATVRRNNFARNKVCKGARRECQWAVLVFV